MEPDMIDGSSDISSRLDSLEERIEHQDKMIAELNEVITSQWRKIDALERQVVRLQEEFENIRTPREIPEAPPPHY